MHNDMQNMEVWGPAFANREIAISRYTKGRASICMEEASMETNPTSTRELKNADFLTWRVNNYKRSLKEKAIKDIFYTRERDRLTSHH